MSRIAVVTGAGGFIGRHLVRSLRLSGVEVSELTRESSEHDIERAVAGADVVYHLAGANRPAAPEEFESTNVQLTRRLVEIAGGQSNRRVIFVLASSTQAERGTCYGDSKLAAEQIVERASPTVSGRIYRLPNVFGRGARPHYNSMVATFCHLAARAQPLPIHNAKSPVTLVYVDDVIQAFLRHLDEDGSSPSPSRCEVEPRFETTVGEVAERISAIGSSRQTLELPDFSDSLTARLYATYLSYLPEESFAYDLEKRSDARGTLAEFLKLPTAGQLFVSRTKPGVTRGHHWHSLKTEKFFVVEGEAVVRFKKVDAAAPSREYRVAGTDFRVLDIPPGYAHSIENVGDTEMVVLFWASETFDPSRPDTWPHQVEA